MTTYRLGSLFSGAGGLDMAVGAVFGAEPAWHCEVDPAAAKVLATHWPNVPNLGDITAVDWTRVEPIDVLCGGFPCQDVSDAGKRAGIQRGNRSGLWSEMAGAIAVLGPRHVVIENVRGLLYAEAHRDLESGDAAMGDGTNRPVLRAIGAVLGDLSDLGYDAQWATVSAASIGAPHTRERVFIVATAAHAGSGRFARHTQRHGQPATGIETSQWHNTVRRSTAVDHLLPTPACRDYKGGVWTVADGNGGRRPITVEDTTAARGSGGYSSLPDTLCALETHLPESWNRYEPSIRMWERLTRPVPYPSEARPGGLPRIRAEFSEWMIGWPQGWVTDVPGVSRTDQFRIIGNGVVPQQAAAAITYLLSLEVAA